MATLAARIAPQRSTQYAALASSLAEPELRLSPLGPVIGALRPVTIAGQPYLLLDLTEPLAPAQLRALGEMGATSAFFWFHEAVGGVPGPFLEPLDVSHTPLLPPELVEARRYRGKTNELFSQVLVNLVRWAHLGRPARLLDPLMGGGTLPFVALQLGFDVAGIDNDRPAIEGTDTFLTKLLQEARVRHKRREERVVGGRRSLFTIAPAGSPRPLLVALVYGPAEAAPTLLANLPGGARFDQIVADLPYGIQHQGQVQALLASGLPAWHAVAANDAVLGLAWDATRISRDVFTVWVEAGGHWQALRGGAWETLGHPVDRVIKRRDLLVARRLAV